MHLCCFDVKYVMHSVLFHVCRARFGLGCFTPNFMYWYGAVVVRGLATTSDKSPAVKFYCPVPHNEYLLCIFHSCAFTVCKIFTFHVLVFDSLFTCCCCSPKENVFVHEEPVGAGCTRARG